MNGGVGRWWSGGPGWWLQEEESVLEYCSAGHTGTAGSPPPGVGMRSHVCRSLQSVPSTWLSRTQSEGAANISVDKTLSAEYWPELYCPGVLPWPSILQWQWWWWPGAWCPVLGTVWCLPPTPRTGWGDLLRPGEQRRERRPGWGRRAELLTSWILSKYICNLLSLLNISCINSTDFIEWLIRII